MVSEPFGSLDAQFRNRVYETLARHESKFNLIGNKLNQILVEIQALRLQRTQPIIPTNVCQLPKLQNFTYSFNYFTGTPPSCDATVVGSKVTSNGTNNCILGKADQRSTKECSSENAHPIDCSKMQSGSSFPPQSMKRPPVPKPQAAKPSHSPIPFVGPSPPPPTSKSSPSTRSQPPPPPTKRVLPTTQLPTDEAQYEPTSAKSIPKLCFQSISRFYPCGQG